MKKTLTLFSLLFCTQLFSPLFALDDDVASWISAGLELPCGDALSFSTKAEVRIADNISAAERKSIELGADYQLNRWIKFDAGYKYMTCLNDNFWYDRHQVRVSLYEVFWYHRWEFQLRERWEYTYTPESHTILGNGDNQLRTLLQANYHAKKLPLSPFGYVELFNNESLQIIRLCAGVEYQIDKHNSFSIDYMHQDKPADGARNSHVIECSYGFCF